MNELPFSLSSNNCHLLTPLLSKHYHIHHYLQTQVDEEEDYDSIPQTSLFPVSQDTTLKGEAHQKNCRK